MSPIYSYLCPLCNFRETDLRSFDERDNQFECRVCETDMKRELSAPRGDVKNPAAGPPRRRK